MKAIGKYQTNRSRINRYFTHVTTFTNLWCSKKDGKWWDNTNAIKLFDGVGSCNYSIKPVKTLRAFRRYLKKHSKYLPKGTEFILVSKYCNYDISGVTK